MWLLLNSNISNLFYKDVCVYIHAPWSELDHLKLVDMRYKMLDGSTYYKLEYTNSSTNNLCAWKDFPNFSTKYECVQTCVKKI